MKRPAGVLADRSYLLFLTARAVSVAGYAVTAIALPLLMFGLTNSAFLTALIAALEVVPYLLFGLLAGAVADRVNRRRLMLTCQAVSGAALASIPLTHAFAALTAEHLLGTAAITATCFVWFDAASFGALPVLVRRDQLAAANSTLFTTATLIEVAVPAAAGFLIAAVGPAPTISFEALTYCLAAALIWHIPRSLGGARPADTTAANSTPSPSGQHSSRQATGELFNDIREGLTFLRHHELVRTLTLVGFGNSVTGGAVQALLVVYAIDALNLSSSDWQLGVLYSAAALGALAASLLLPTLTRRVPVGWITIAALTLNPVLVLALAAAPTLTVALPMYFLWATTWMLTIINGITTRQLATPDHLQSRVNTTARMIAWGGAPLGAAVGGVLAQATNIRLAYAILTCAVSASATQAWLSPLRRSTSIDSADLINALPQAS